MSAQTALIFGASGGIGSMVCRHLQVKKIPVTASSRGEGDILGDVSDAQFVQQAFEWHKKKFKHPPSIVINAAAIQSPMGMVWECSTELIAQNIQVNLLGSVWVAREAIKQMGKGSLILFSGGGATSARPGLTSYSLAKTAVVRLVENLDAELKLSGRQDLVVNAVAPGAVATEMMSELVAEQEKLPLSEVEAARAVLLSGGTPAEKICELIDFLIDPQQHRGLSGRLIHVREPYVEFVKQYSETGFPEHVGKLTRKGI